MSHQKLQNFENCFTFTEHSTFLVHPFAGGVNSSHVVGTVLCKILISSNCIASCSRVLMAEYLLDSDPKGVPPDKYRQMFRTFLEEYEFEQIEKMLLKVGCIDDHHPVFISSQDLVHFDPALAYSLLHYPKLLLPVFEEALNELQTQLCSHVSNKNKYSGKLEFKLHSHIRVTSVPPTADFCKPTISDIKAHDVDGFVQVAGTVVRTGGVRMLEQSKQYECQNPKCRFRFTVCADPEQDNMLPQPRCCPAKALSAAQGGSQSEYRCNSANVRELEGGSVCVDYQEVRLQDHLERLALGSVPRSITVVLHSDLVDRFNPGDDVVVVGTLVRQWRPVGRGTRCTIDIAIEANSVTLANDSTDTRVATETSVAQFRQFWVRYPDQGAFVGRNVVLRAVCPQLFGMFYVKLALLLALIGGNGAAMQGGVRRRSQSHLLVVGDPGCGKSQLLRFAASVVPRSVITTGIGTTGAGLTCTAVREGNDWCLEAGALVLSDGGVCCIDEFASIREADRATIHEAMEQQSVSVAKAGLVVRLNTRATVIACCNPKGAYDVTADLSANTAIASPLLSRFDLILVLMDAASKDWDTQVSTFLLLQAVGADSGGHARVHPLLVSAPRAGGGEAEADCWSLATLRQYVACVKSSVHPAMSAEARCVLMRYYQLQRQSDERSSARTTVRLLESLLRLSEAHAKLMFRDTVTLVDAVVAVHCVSLAAPQSASLLDSTRSASAKDDFSADPAAQYAQVEQHVFRLLHYSAEALAREVALAQQQQPKDSWSIRRDTHGDDDDDDPKAETRGGGGDPVVDPANGAAVESRASDTAGSARHSRGDSACFAQEACDRNWSAAVPVPSPPLSNEADLSAGDDLCVDDFLGSQAAPLGGGAPGALAGEEQRVASKRKWSPDDGTALSVPPVAPLPDHGLSLRDEDEDDW